MDQNIIQKALSSVRNTAKKIVDFSFNTPGVGFQRIGQEITRNPQQFNLFSPKNVAQQSYNAQSLAQSNVPVVSQFGKYAGQNLINPTLNIYNPNSSLLSKVGSVGKIGLNAYGLGKIAAQPLINTGIQALSAAGIGGGLSKITGGSFLKGAEEGLLTLPEFAGASALGGKLVGGLTSKIAPHTKDIEAALKAGQITYNEARQLAGSLGQRLSKSAIEGFAGMAPIGFTEEAKTPEERIKNTLTQGLMGAAFGAGTEALGTGFNKIGEIWNNRKFSQLKPLLKESGLSKETKEVLGSLDRFNAYEQNKITSLLANYQQSINKDSFRIENRSVIQSMVDKYLPSLKNSSFEEQLRTLDGLIAIKNGSKPSLPSEFLTKVDKELSAKYAEKILMSNQEGKVLNPFYKDQKVSKSGLTPKVTTKVKIKPKTEPVIAQEPIQLPVKNISPTEKLSLPQGDYTLKQKIGDTTSKYNIGRNKTVNQRVIKQALDEVAPAFEKQIGGPITHEQIIKQASEFSDDVIKTIGRKTTEDLGAAQLRLRQNIASMADTGKVTPELLEAMKTDASFARSTAQLLGQRAIDANPQTPFGRNMIKYIKAVNEVADNIDLVVEKAKGVDFNDIEQSSTFYRQFIKPTAGDWVDKLRFSSMLSSPNTVINNASSNFQGTGLLTPIEKTISGGIDAIVSGLKGTQRKHFAGEGIEYAKGYWSNMKTAIQNFSSAMKGGSDAGEMFNIKLTEKGTAERLAEESLSFFPRLSQATDEFFNALTTGGLEKANIYRATKGGVNQTADQIALEAKRRLFNQPFGSDQSYLLNALEFIPSKIMDATHSKNPYIKWTAKFAFPFIRIPTNVFKAGIEYSPLGVATLPGANNQIEQASKALMGTTVALGAWQLANADRLTFGMPTSEKQRDAFTAAGMQPYSIKIGDKWFSYTKFHPIVGFNMALASSLKEQLDKKTLSDDQLDTVIGIAGKWLTYFANQSYVKQMGDFMSLSQGNETAVGKAIGNYPSQLIPFRAFLGWLARAFDPNERKIDPDGSKIDKSLQSIMMSIPGARNTLMPRTNSQGQPVEQQNRFLNLISPSKVTNEIPQEKQIYDTLKQKSIQTSKENAIKQQLKTSGGTSSSLGGDRYTVIDKNTGDALTIDLSPVQKPTATGNTELDKKLFSSYNSKITSQITGVTKLYEAGEIDANKAEELIKQLQSQRPKSIKKVRVKKPKKLTLKKVKTPKISKIKLKKIKIAKVKPIKFKKIKQSKLAKLKTKKIKS